MNDVPSAATFPTPAAKRDYRQLVAGAIGAAGDLVNDVRGQIRDKVSQQQSTAVQRVNGVTAALVSGLRGRATQAQGGVISTIDSLHQQIQSRLSQAASYTNIVHGKLLPPSQTFSSTSGQCPATITVTLGQCTLLPPLTIMPPMCGYGTITLTITASYAYPIFAWFAQVLVPGKYGFTVLAQYNCVTNQWIISVSSSPYPDIVFTGVANSQGQITLTYKSPLGQVLATMDASFSDNGAAAACCKAGPPSSLPPSTPPPVSPPTTPPLPPAGIPPPVIPPTQQQCYYWICDARGDTNIDGPAACNANPGDPWGTDGHVVSGPWPDQATASQHAPTAAEVATYCATLPPPQQQCLPSGCCRSFRLNSDGSWTAELDPDKFPQLVALISPVIAAAVADTGESESEGFEDIYQYTADFSKVITP